MSKSISNKGLGAMPSPRALIQQHIVDFLLGDRDRWSAPYGIIYSDSLGADRRSRNITFGRARTLDATISIFGPKFITLRTNRHGIEKFTDANTLIDYIDKNL